MSGKVAMISLGCSKNQVDAEVMLAILKDSGYTIENEPSKADAVIINTCGFIEAAKEEAIENILEIGKLKEEGRIKALIVSGCLAQRYQDEILKEMPEIDAVVGIASKENIAEAVKKALEGKEKYADFKPVTEYRLGGDRMLSTPFYTAYLKIADGCDNRCSYCAIPLIRGNYISRPFEELVDEAKKLAESGVFELNIIAQDTTRYGLDLYGHRRLPELLTELCKIEGLKWIRILYVYPDEVSDELIEVMAKEPKIVKYIDIPLQHANDKILKAMNRRQTKADILELISKIRVSMPEAVIRTTFIAGFPGETRSDFKELVEFIKTAEFDRVGVFTFSPEEGTAAAQLKDDVSEDEKKRRKDIIEQEAARIVDQKNASKVGTVQKVLVEGYDRYAETFFGRTSSDAPEVDGKVFFTSKGKLEEGKLIDVLITQVVEYDLFGEIQL
ncbi:MAG: 30S ribosomal protein S12 methylthiotransferase RimO [Bacillota bacterium]|nr:30S ribosomal protein S12 methylthiotransferase RimO [Bacillota bacterium]